MIKEILLSGAWEMSYLKNRDGKDYKSSSELKNDGLTVIPATVPGNLELDLYNAGHCEDPFFGLNPYRVRKKTENLHSYYFRSFDVDNIDGIPFLFFEGVDCYADIYLNGKLIAKTDNMLIEHKINVKDSLKIGENELFLHIKPACVEASKYDYNPLLSPGNASYSFLYMRKATHMCGWDIMPRFISAGIWKDVKLIFEPEDDFIEEFYLNTAAVTEVKGDGGFDFGADDDKFSENDVALQLFIKFRGDLDEEFTLSLDGTCKDSVIHYECPMIFTGARRDFKVKNAKLWWPLGQGEQNIYDFTLTLYKNGKPVDTKKFSQGLRTSEVIFKAGTPGVEKSKFDVLINGRKIFCKGTNWVPADAFHSRDKDHIVKKLELATELECNMIRCWGGNVYENDIFYDYCDRHGIMVWQDFAFACCKYPTDDEFCERVRIEAETVVKRLRHHACITLWAGDNENDKRYWDWEPYKLDPNNVFINRISREVLPKVVANQDPYRPYLPSSPYLSPDIIENPDALRPEAHIWTTYYYKAGSYKNSQNNFVSETGYFGAPSPLSVKQFISPDKLWPGLDNDEWNYHSTSSVIEYYKATQARKPFRIPAHFEELAYLFDGEVADLKDFAVKSQITQAEALKFIIERFRSQKWEKTGLLWWNLCDGWPQFSDAIVDYYYRKKLAFHYIKNCQKNVCVMLCENENEAHEIMLVNDTDKDVNINYKITDVDSGEVLTQGRGFVKANQNVSLGNMAADSKKQAFFLIEWWGDADGKNHYLAGEPKYDIDKYLSYMKKSGLYDNWLEEIKEW